MAGSGTTRRIAIVVPTHWAHFMGGSQYQARLLIEALNRRTGVELAYFAARVPSTDRLAGQVVYRTGRAQYLRRFGHFWDYFSLQKVLQEFDPHLIYQRVLCAHTGICARYSHRKNVPMIWHVANERDCWPTPAILSLLARPHRLIESRLKSYGLRRADHIVAQTKEQADMLRKNFGIDVAAVIPNFHPAPDETGSKSDVFTVVWVANLKEIKRPDLAIKIATLLEKDRSIRFELIGAPYSDPAEQRHFEAAVDSLQNVKYLGALDQGDVNSRIGRAHVLVNTSVVEGFSNTFIQAWMREVPIATIGVNPDGILDDGVMGKDCRNVEEAAEFIKMLSRDRSRLAEMGLKSRERSMQSFSMQNAETLADLMFAAIDERPLLLEGAGLR